MLPEQQYFVNLLLEAPRCRGYPVGLSLKAEAITHLAGQVVEARRSQRTRGAELWDLPRAWVCALVLTSGLGDV